MDSVQVEHSELVGSAVKDFYMRTLSILFHQLCVCDQRNGSMELNPKAHSEECQYRIKINEAGLDFDNGIKY